LTPAKRADVVAPNDVPVRRPMQTPEAARGTAWTGRCGASVSGACNATETRDSAREAASADDVREASPNEPRATGASHVWPFWVIAH
jgi:hypothetical protein